MRGSCIRGDSDKTPEDLDSVPDFDHSSSESEQEELEPVRHRMTTSTPAVR